MARRAVFIVVDVVRVFSEKSSNAGDSAEWTVRPQASVRKLTSMHNAYRVVRNAWRETYYTLGWVSVGKVSMWKGGFWNYFS